MFIFITNLNLKVIIVINILVILPLFSRFKDKVQTLKWETIFDRYKQDFPKILNLIDFIFTLPASSSENERAFSIMKLTKTDRRTRMNTDMLNDLMTVKIVSQSVQDFNPAQAVSVWMEKRCNPYFMVQGEKRKKVVNTIPDLQTEMKRLYRGSYIDASCQVWFN